MIPWVSSCAGLFLVLALALPPGGSALAADTTDPDWPCVQAQVPTLSPAQFWTEGDPQAAAARAPLDASGKALAARLALRRTSLDDAATLIAGFAEAIPEAERSDALAALFAEVFHRINGHRGRVMEGIGRYATGQARLAEQIRQERAQIAMLEVTEGSDPDRIATLKADLVWRERTHHDRRRSLTYVCEVPVLLEQRLFALARQMAADLAPKE